MEERGREQLWKDMEAGREKEGSEQGDSEVYIYIYKKSRFKEKTEDGRE